MEVSANWFLDKHFSLLKPVKFYNNVDANGIGIDYQTTLQPGAIINIDSYMDRTQTPCNCVWLSTYDPITKKSYYFKYDKDIMSWIKNYTGYQPDNHFQTDIIDTGAFGDAVSEAIKPIAKWVLGIVLASVIGKVVVNKAFDNKKI